MKTTRTFTSRLKLTVLATAISLSAAFVLSSHTTLRQVDAQRSGAAIYSQNCARCHGTDGRAQTAKGRQVKAVDLTSDEWSPDEGRDTRIVTKGKGSMPSFKSKLTPDEISAVASYIRRFKN
jgi:mono/diheme cytochrome c family protein